MTEEVKNVINEDLTNPTLIEGELDESLEKEIVTEETISPPGSKTDPALLLISLKEEREKRRDMEGKIKELEEQLLSSTPVEEEHSHEGMLLQKEIQALKSELSGLKEGFIKKDVLMDYPILKDKWSEFEEFCQDSENKGMGIKTAAKVFLIENGFSVAPRKGLEKPTGGDKTPKPSGMTTEEVKILRETNFRKYQDMLNKGQINIVS